jgi:hypothetical protein
MQDVARVCCSASAIPLVIGLPKLVVSGDEVTKQVRLAELIGLVFYRDERAQNDPTLRVIKPNILLIFEILEKIG